MASEPTPPNPSDLPKMQLDPKHDDYDYPTTSPHKANGHPGHTTPQQDAQVHQLRMILEAEGCTERLDTLTLLRFLRARKFDVMLAKKMFLECEQWRKDFGGGVDKLTQTFEYWEREEMFKFYPQYYHKTDKDGRPVYIEHLGNINLTAMNAVTTDERMLQNLVVEYEKVADPRLPACSRKAGQLLETCCTIMDCKGVSLSTAPSVYSYLQRASGISQNYYPERLGKLYIINAPWGFAGVFSVVRRFLDPVTVAKIHILGSGYEKDLLDQIPKHNLPHFLGGACVCDKGCMFSDMGPWQDGKWAKPPKWAKKEAKEAEENGAVVNEEPAKASAPAPAAGQGQHEANGQVAAA